MTNEMSRRKAMETFGHAAIVAAGLIATTLLPNRSEAAEQVGNLTTKGYSAEETKQLYEALKVALTAFESETGIHCDGLSFRITKDSVRMSDGGHSMRLGLSARAESYEAKESYDFPGSGSLPTELEIADKIVGTLRSSSELLKRLCK